MRKQSPELSPDARALFRSAREGALPSLAARTRSTESLAALSGGETARAAPFFPATQPRRISLALFGMRPRLLLAAALVFVTAASVAAVHKLRPLDAPPALSPRDKAAAKPLLAQRARTVLSPPAVPGPEPNPEELASVDLGARLASPAANKKGDTGDDLLLLGKARQSLAAHQGGESLRWLAEDARRFPSSPLREERAYTRIRALCELGRVNDVRTEAERFLHRWPGSVYAAGVRRACAAASSGAPVNDSLTGSRAAGH